MRGTDHQLIDHVVGVNGARNRSDGRVLRPAVEKEALLEAPGLVAADTVDHCCHRRLNVVLLKLDFKVIVKHGRSGRPPSSLALRPRLRQAKRFAVQSVLGGGGKLR